MGIKAPIPGVHAVGMQPDAIANRHCAPYIRWTTRGLCRTAKALGDGFEEDVADDGGEIPALDWRIQAIAEVDPFCWVGESVGARSDGLAGGAGADFEDALAVGLVQGGYDRLFLVEINASGGGIDNRNAAGAHGDIGDLGIGGGTGGGGEDAFEVLDDLCGLLGQVGGGSR